MVKTHKYSFILILVAIIWGSGFPATEMAIRSNFSPLYLIFLRFIVATIFFSIVFFKDIFTIDRTDLKHGCLAGFFLFCGYALQTVGLQYTTPSNSAFLTATGVILIPFIMYLFYKTPIKKKVLFSSLLCFFGVSLLSFSFSEGFTFNVGDLLTLACSIFYALHVCYVSHISKNHNIGKLSIIQFASVTVFSFIYVLFFEFNTLSKADYSSGLLPILYMGIFCTGICYFLQFTAQRHVTSNKTSMILSTEALFASLFSIVLGMEPFRISILFGGILILLSLLILEVNFTSKNQDNRLTS